MGVTRTDANSEYGVRLRIDLIKNCLANDGPQRRCEFDRRTADSSRVVVQCGMFALRWRMFVVAATVYLVLSAAEPTRVAREPCAVGVEDDVVPALTRSWHGAMVADNRPFVGCASSGTALRRSWSTNAGPESAKGRVSARGYPHLVPTSGTHTAPPGGHLTTSSPGPAPCHRRFCPRGASDKRARVFRPRLRGSPGRRGRGTPSSWRGGRPTW